MPKTDPKDSPKDSPGDVNLETHPLVARLHADPDELTDLVALAGYLGPSKREGYVRLYADLTFRNYYEIPTDGIVSTSPADASDENSPTTVHVSGGTQVDRVSITSQSTEARFLQGSIASDYLGTAGAGSCYEWWSYPTLVAQAGAGAGSQWPTCWCATGHNCQQGAAQVGAPSMVYSCWCNITKNNCQQGAAQAGQAYWPASPTCWCWHTQQNCQQAGARVAQPYTDTVFHTCGCSIGNYTCNNCGQAGAQAQAAFWPASPTCWCNITRNCAQQAGAADVGCSWPASPTCWCNITRNCAQANAQYWTTAGTCFCATQIQCHTSQGCT